MKIVVNRLWKKEAYTIGRLYVNGEYVCDTLEDTDRGLRKSMLSQDIVRIKVPERTAIPRGIYDVRLDVFSPHFGYQDFYRKTCKGCVPRIEDVPGFEGVLIHTGNTASDTAGCILVGRNTVVGGLTRSREMFEKLYAKIRGQKELTIEII
mgnify:CR=1 FL=1